MTQAQRALKTGLNDEDSSKQCGTFWEAFYCYAKSCSDLKDFFSHEIQPFPPSLSKLGKPNLPTNKSDLIKCLQPSNQPEQPSFYDCKVLDGAVIVHCLPTAGVHTFNDYAEEVFVPYLRM